jgi:hypothetical protein
VALKSKRRRSSKAARFCTDRHGVVKIGSDWTLPGIGLVTVGSGDTTWWFESFAKGHAMYMRVAGCVAGIVGVLGWEAATAAVHPTLNLKAAEVVQMEDPLLALSEGVIATPTTPTVQHDRGRTWSFATPHRATSHPCSVASVSSGMSCSEPAKHDAGVAPVSASPAACEGAGPG